MDLPDDSNFENDETFRIDLDTASFPAGMYVSGITQTRVTIKDNDYSISTNNTSYTAREDGGGASVEVTISPAQERTVGVRVSFQNLSAVAGQNYLAEHHSFPDGVLTFYPGETTKSFFIPVVNDGVVKPNSIFQVTLTQTVGPTDPLTRDVVISEHRPADGEYTSKLILERTSPDTVSEGHDATFRLTMHPPVQKASTVAVALAQSADDGERANWIAGAPQTRAHYVTVDFNRGDSEKTLTVRIGSDGRDTNGTLTVAAMTRGLHPKAAGTYTARGRKVSAKLRIKDTVADGDPQKPASQDKQQSSDTQDAQADTTPSADCVSDAQWDTVEGYYDSNAGKAPNYGANWYRVLIAYQADRSDKTLPAWTGATATPTTAFTVSEAVTQENTWSGWTPVRKVLACLQPGGTQTSAVTVSVEDAQVQEGPNAQLVFTVRLSAAGSGQVSVDYASSDNTARAGDDYGSVSGTLVFAPSETVKQVRVPVYDDSHDEGSETMALTLSNPSGATLADGTAVGTINNTDPLPSAFLSRFGRGLAEQAVDGITGRLTAERSEGFTGQFLGNSFTGNNRTTETAHAPGQQPALAQGSAPAFAADGEMDSAALAGTSNTGTGMAGTGISMNSAGMTSTGITNTNMASVGMAGMSVPSGTGALSGTDARVGPTAMDTTPMRTVTLTEALAGSSFTYTRETDESGGSFGLWGRGMHSTFSGAEGSLHVDGELTTGLIGLDYARHHWQGGLAVLLTGGKGAFRGETGHGKLDTAMTAFVPYIAKQTGRLNVWGTAGIGVGELTLNETVTEIEHTESLSTDLGWQMAAGGLRSDLGTLLGDTGPSLALIGDAQWTRTTSEKITGLAESEAQTTRLRLGVEGGWSLHFPDQRLRPTLEAGVRYDGGDADTGLGIELGAGISWSHTRWGVAIDIAGRTLVAHEDEDFTHSGFSAAVTFDPDLTSLLGPSLTLTHTLGGQSSGGLDALFGESLPGSQASGNAQGHWEAKAAYGMPIFQGRFIGAPSLGYTLNGQASGYHLGWSLTPSQAHRLNLSAEVAATRNELPGAAADHGVNLQLRSQW